MASSCSTYTSSQETTNFARICRIVVDVLRDVLWQVLIHEVLPADLPIKVRTNQNKLGKLDVNINKWLCGISPSSPDIPKAENFDVTSLYTLIRNLCSQVKPPSTQWGKTPPTNGTTLGDDIERVREFRNTLYGHATQAKIDIADFNNLCTYIKKVVSRFDVYFNSISQAMKCNFVSEVVTILTCNMDKTLEDAYIDRMKENAVSSYDLGDVKQQVGDIKRQVDIVNLQVGDTKQQVDIVKQQVDIVNQQVCDTKHQVDIVKQQVCDTKHQVDIVKQQVGDTKHQVDIVNQQVCDTKQQVVIVKQEVDIVNQQVGDTKQQVDFVSQQVGDIKKKVDIVDQQVGDIKQQVDFVSQQVGDTKQQVENLQSKVDVVIKERMETKNQGVNLRNCSCKTDADIAELEETHKKIPDIIENGIIVGQEDLQTKEFELMIDGSNQAISLDKSPLQSSEVGVQMPSIEMEGVEGYNDPEADKQGSSLTQNFKLEDIDKAWQSVEAVVQEHVHPKYLLDFFTKEGILSADKRQDLLEMKRREMSRGLLQIVKDNLPNAFNVLLEALKTDGEDKVIHMLMKIVHGENVEAVTAPVPDLTCFSVTVAVKKDGKPVLKTEETIIGSFKTAKRVLECDLYSVIISVKRGSVITHLQPLNKHALETLKLFCKHVGIQAFGLDLLKKKDIYATLPAGKICLDVQVCCHKEDHSGGSYEPQREIIPESSEVVNDPQVIKMNLLLQYSSLLEEIEPIHLQKIFMDRGIFVDGFFQELKNLQRRERVCLFLNKILDTRSDQALVALVDALKGSGDEALAAKLCYVGTRTPLLGDTDVVDDSMVQVVEATSKTCVGEDVLWSCHLEVMINRNANVIIAAVQLPRNWLPLPEIGRFVIAGFVEEQTRDGHGGSTLPPAEHEELRKMLKQLASETGMRDRTVTTTASKVWLKKNPDSDISLSFRDPGLSEDKNKIAACFHEDRKWLKSHPSASGVQQEFTPLTSTEESLLLVTEEPYNVSSMICKKRNVKSSDNLSIITELPSDFISLESEKKKKLLWSDLPFRVEEQTHDGHGGSTLPPAEHEELREMLRQLASDNVLGPQISMKYEMLRLCTMGKFPRQVRPFAIRIIEAGFYYAGHHDQVICYCCGNRKDSWVLGDIPLLIHENMAPDCGFLTHNALVNVPIRKANSTESPSPAEVRLLAIQRSDGSNQSDTAQGESSLMLPSSEQNRVSISNMSHQMLVTNKSSPPNQLIASGRQNVLDNLQTVSAHSYSMEEPPRKYPQYAVKNMRINSFQGWPAEHRQRPEEMAECGFYYAGFSDCVRCFFCGVGLRHWMSEDDPWIEHARWSTECVYVCKIKGEEFVSLVKMAVEIAEREEAIRNDGGGNQALQNNNEAAPAVPATEAPNKSGTANSTAAKDLPGSVGATDGRVVKGAESTLPPGNSEIQKYLLTDAAQSILDMGYQPKLVLHAIERVLMKKGSEDLTGQIIMEAVFEIEEEDKSQGRTQPVTLQSAEGDKSTEKAVRNYCIHFGSIFSQSCLDLAVASHLNNSDSVLATNTLYEVSGNIQSEESQIDPEKIMREHRELREATLCKIYMENNIVQNLHGKHHQCGFSALWSPCDMSFGRKSGFYKSIILGLGGDERK